MRHYSSLVAIVGAAAIVVSASAAVPTQDRAPATPAAAVDALLAADRAFASASGKVDLVSGLSAMFAPDVVMPAPPGQLAQGAAKATETLSSNPDNARAKIEWAPIRGGISADGLHGFTFGYMTMTRADGVKVPLKYLAYWVKGPAGWRVAVYKRGRRGDGAASTTVMAPALPAALVPQTSDAAALAKHRQSLDAAERAFSAEAQKIGLGAAFAKYGSADAVNMGGPTDAAFVVGGEAIGKAVGAGGPTTSSPVSWAPDKVIVASSGDLGVTIGWIRPNAPAADGTPAAAVPFFTIWRRPNADSPWRYVAE